MIDFLKPIFNINIPETTKPPNPPVRNFTHGQMSYSRYKSLKQPWHKLIN